MAHHWKTKPKGTVPLTFYSAVALLSLYALGQTNLLLGAAVAAFALAFGLAVASAARK